MTGTICCNPAGLGVEFGLTAVPLGLPARFAGEISLLGPEFRVVVAGDEFLLVSTIAPMAMAATNNAATAGFFARRINFASFLFLAGIASNYSIVVKAEKLEPSRRGCLPSH